jgi:hypothetical protein
MPRLRPKHWKPRPDEIALCVETFSNVAGDVVRAGDLFPGDHPLVHAHLQYFAKAMLSVNPAAPDASAQDG